MAVQRHPMDSWKSLKVNFWEEFPDYKIHKIFGKLWKENRKADKLKASSDFMWALTLCYDRKSSFYNQPELDKWQAVSEDFWKDEHFLRNLATEESEQDIIILPDDFMNYVDAFERSLDTPLGMSLRMLERKLAERTEFIRDTEYTMDYYEMSQTGKPILKKGTADQLDRMFRDTDKINSLIQKALDELKASEGSGSVKGGGIESLGDGDNTF